MPKAMLVVPISVVIAIVFLIIVVSFFYRLTEKVETPPGEKKEACGAIDKNSDGVDDDCENNLEGFKCITKKEPHFCGCYNDENCDKNAGYKCGEPEQKCKK